MKRIDDWKHSWKYFSQWCFTAAGALSIAWTNLGALQSTIPAKYATGIAGAICVLGFIGRLVDQSGAKDDAQNP